MTPQELKSSILQLAIQGKLVEQRSEEGTGEELYRQIQAEKQSLIQAGKIKKEKPLPEIADDEVPFEIPESWKWVRIGSLLYKLVDGTHRTPKYTVTGVPFVSVRNISSGQLNLESTRFIAEKEHRELWSRCNPQKGDILLSKVGTTGVPAKVDTEKEFSLFVSVALLKFSQELLSCDFLIYSILAPDFQKQCKEHTRGVGNKNWVIADIANTMMPLPPLAEQKRIVAQIEELLPYLDRYEKAWNRLEDFNRRFPADMQKSILQMAIQGKLVEQRPEEGTGEALYRQIQAEKQALIKAGKIKKEKPLPEIAEDEVPFEIPEGWKWVRLGGIVDKLTDGSHNPPPNTGKGYPVISAKNVKNGLITFDNVDRYTDEVGYQKENSRTDIKFGDVIMGIIGGSIGNVARYTHSQRVIAQRSIAIIHSMIDTAYFIRVLESPLVQGKLKSTASGSAQGGVYLGTLASLPIPLPPLAEQKRIVARLEGVLPLCERLK